MCEHKNSALRCAAQPVAHSSPPRVRVPTVAPAVFRSALLLVLATFETTYHKGKRRYAGMFWAILASMLVTCGIAAIFGTLAWTLWRACDPRIVFIYLSCSCSCPRLPQKGRRLR